MLGVWVWYRVRELDPTCNNSDLVQPNEKKKPKLISGFPGDSVVKNPPQCRRHRFDPWSGRSHIRRATKTVLESPGAIAPESTRSRASVPQEKPPKRKACTLQPESCPHSPQLNRRPHTNKDPAQPKTKHQTDLSATAEGDKFLAFFSPPTQTLDQKGQEEEDFSGP